VIEPDSSIIDLTETKTRPSISIVIPTLNADRYLQETLDSISRQHIGSLEVLVVDGGSSDNTRAISRASTLPLRWIDLPAAGQAAAINHGFAAATGELLAWLNSDDLYEPGALETVLDFFDKNPDRKFLYGDAVAMDAKGRRYGRRQHVRPSDTATLLVEDCIVQPSSFWRADVWHTHGPLTLDLDCVFDYDYFIRVSRDTELCYLPVPLSAERLHADQKTARGGLGRLEELARLNHLHTGIDQAPRSFAAERTAALLATAIKALMDPNPAAAIEHLRLIERPLGHPIKVAARTLASLTRGETGLVGLALRRNLLRHRWQSRHLLWSGRRSDSNTNDDP